MGKMQRRKGHDFERAIAGRLREIMPSAGVKRGLQGRDGSDAPDVVAPAFWVECKRGRTPPIRPALAQAEKANPGGYWSTAVTKADREPALVTMYLDDWLELVEQWWRGRS